MSRSVMRVAPQAKAARPTPGNMYALFPLKQLQRDVSGYGFEGLSLESKHKVSMQEMIYNNFP